MDGVLRVLVVDDSAYVRKVVREMLSRSPFIEVIGAARDGREALEMTERLKPDVVTCDLIMPELDGVGFVREQMRRRPLPIVIMSVADENAEAVLNALDSGAVDFLQKPTALASERILEVSSELIDKVKAAGNISVDRIQGNRSNGEQTAPADKPIHADIVVGSHSVDIVVLGVSTGGPQALKTVIPQLPADFPVPVALVMHMPVGYTEMYARRLDELSPLNVREATEGDVLRPGIVLVARAGRTSPSVASRTFKGNSSSSTQAYVQCIQQAYASPKPPGTGKVRRQLGNDRLQSLGPTVERQNNDIDPNDLPTTTSRYGLALCAHRWSDCLDAD